MTAPWWVEMRAEQLVLELRELLVRFDENIAAHMLMQHCIPYYLDDATHPAIARAREEQAQMVDHIFGDSYAHYYETNHHERPFEEQYQCEAEKAHENLHRVRFLRRWLEEQLEAQRHRLVLDSYVSTLTLLDVACNDGWMAKNLEGLVTYTGIDLNPHCIERAKGRKVPGANFAVGFAEDADALHINEDGQVVEGLPGIRSKKDRGFDVVVAYELIEHVRDPARILEVMASACRPGGSLFVSTPLGAGTGGDLPRWWFVEPKGHVRAFTPQTFAELLSVHGQTHIEISDTQGHGQLMVARVDIPIDSRTNGTEPVRADRARVRAILARLEDPLQLNVEIANIASAVTAADEKASLVPIQPANIWDFVPPPSFLTDFPTLGIQDMGSRIEDDTGSTATGRHSFGVVIFCSDPDQHILTWQLRRYAQAVTRVLVRGRAFDETTPPLQAGWGVGFESIAWGPTLSSTATPTTWMSWCVIGIWARREEI